MPDDTTSAPADDGTDRRPLAVDATGQAPVSFTHGPEHALTTAHHPMPAALWCGGRVLLVHDRYRKSWELPGDMIEPEETPRAAALRELLEETGQIPDGPVRFVGLAHFLLGLERRTEFLALYTGRIDRPLPFEANDEIGAVHWWHPDEPLDAYLARLCRPSEG
ncbi:NUDIX hydrolase [Streptomyces sp. NPDC001493]